MKVRVLLIGLAAALVVACITINVYFPEAAIKDLSEQIEEQVAKQAGVEEVEPAPTPEPDESGKAGLVSSEPSYSLLGGGVAFAADREQVAAPEISNPAIRKIIDSRADRLEALQELKATGVIGESKQALVVVRNLEAVTSLRERATVQRLVKAENADREQLFKEIAAAKNVDLAQLPRIRSTYAATLRAKARPGDWIELPDGTWKQK